MKLNRMPAAALLLLGVIWSSAVAAEKPLCFSYAELLGYLDDYNMSLIVVGLPGSGSSNKTIQFWRNIDGVWLVASIEGKKGCIVGSGEHSSLRIGAPAKELLRTVDPKAARERDRQLLDGLLGKPEGG